MSLRCLQSKTTSREELTKTMVELNSSIHVKFTKREQFDLTEESLKEDLKKEKPQFFARDDIMKFLRPETLLKQFLSDHEKGPSHDEHGQNPSRGPVRNHRAL